jgi:hypothetical protein
MTTFRQINADVKRAFKDRPGFVPCKASVIGSVRAIRFEGDLPMSLVTDIARFVEVQFPTFACIGGRTQRVFAFIENGTVINWA